MNAFRSRLSGGASFLAAAVALSGTAHAQTAADTAEAPVDEIVVSSSRIDAAGFDAPTPTMHLNNDDLTIGSRANVAAALNDMPQFRATTSPQTTGTNTGAGQAPVDLRGLGNNRTLVLMDGRRFSSENDLNTVPSNMLRGVDVVTGGASAAWGSGAVAGVVNLQVDNTFEGLEIGGSTGISSYGDDREFRADAKFGTSFADGRGHFVIGGEFYDSEGVIPKNSRPNIGRWANFNGTLTPDVGYGNMAYGGLITSGSLAGQAFNADGSLRDYDYGDAQAGNFSAGGEGPSNDDWSPLVTPQRRYAALASLSYELTSSIKVTAQVRHSRMYNDYIWFGDNIQGSGTSGQWINADNAFLSQDIRDELAAANETGFYLGRANRDLAYSSIDFERKTTQGTLAFDGTLANGFRWSAYYSHGEYQNNIDTPGFLLSENFANAVDAVYDASGNIVCRSNLDGSNPGCVPVNLFGFGSPSDEAIDYVTGTPSMRSKTKLDVGGVSLRGEPISLPAGDVSFSIGGEIRHESISQTVGELDAANAFRTFSFSALSGGYTVSEGFAEVAVPLVHDTPLLRKLSFNGAARISHYSTTGSIWSWKLGATNEFFPGFVGRVTRSRDIRSANLSELYTQQTTGYNTIQNPFRRNADGTPVSEYVLSNGGGNPNLNPETADTWTFGATYSPPSIPRLNVSVDYYNINIDDVITSIAAQDLITRCYNGNTALCGNITFGDDNSITRTVSGYVNLSNYKTDGIDAQVDYVLPLADLGANSNDRLRFNVKGTWVNSLTTNDGESEIEYVRSQGYSFGLGVPKWRVNTTLGYEGDKVSGLVRARYISPGEYNSTLTITNNHIPAYVYVDAQLSFTIENDKGPDMELFLNASNLFDKDPPIGSLYSPYYDVIGRFVTAGARIKF